MIQLSKKTADELKKILSQHEDKDYMVRIAVQGFGWGGPNFVMALEESQSDNDVLEEVQGVSFVIDRNLADHLNTITIDYYQTMFGNGNFSIYAM